MSYKMSFVDTAYKIVEQEGKEASFASLWTAVCAELGLTEEEKRAKVAYFYTQLTLDGRFVTLGENVWDLRERHEFEKVHIDMNDVYADDVEEETSNDEDEDIKDDIDQLNSDEETYIDIDEDEEEDY